MYENLNVLPYLYNLNKNISLFTFEIFYVSSNVQIIFSKKKRIIYRFLNGCNLTPLSKIIFLYKYAKPSLTHRWQT